MAEMSPITGMMVSILNKLLFVSDPSHYFHVADMVKRACLDSASFKAPSRPGQPSTRYLSYAKQ